MPDFKEHLMEIAGLPPIAEQEAWLKDHGFVVMDRNPRANTDFPGSLMIIDTDTLSILGKTELTFANASELDGWCIVGDDRDDLIQNTFTFHYVFEPPRLDLKGDD